MSDVTDVSAYSGNIFMINHWFMYLINIRI